jgi:DNA-binding CsgD family transcriptional regulator
LLETLPPGRELAMAYSNLSQLHMLAYRVPAAVEWGERAIELATDLGDQPILAHALTNVGTARGLVDAAARATIVEGARIARECGLHDDVARAQANLAFGALVHRDLADADRFIAEALEFTSDHDLIPMHLYFQVLRVELWVLRGAWDQALTEASAIADRASAFAPARIVALTAIGRVRARRGQDPSVALDEALALAEQTRELMRLGPVRAARAESAWLAGDLELAAAEIEPVWAAAASSSMPWVLGELALWRWRSGREVGDLASLAEPYALEIGGKPLEAASAWHARGLPLEEARALVEARDVESLREALATFDRLGARADANRAIQALREAGVTHIPRGPRPTTRANAAGLTARELEILQHLAQGQTNQEIADALFLSPRTVGHHVSAILAKLGISSRAKARSRAEELGLF